MTKSIKPDYPSKKDYLHLSKELERKGLPYRRYRQLVWYQENYGPMTDLPFNKEQWDKKKKKE